MGIIEVEVVDGGGLGGGKVPVEGENSHTLLFGLHTSSFTLAKIRSGRG